MSTSPIVYQTTAYEMAIADTQNSPISFPPRPFVVDREYELAKLVRYLHPDANPQGFLVYGVGGIGKTTVAIEAAYRAKERRFFKEFIFMTARKSYWDFKTLESVSADRKGRYRFASFSGLLRELSIYLGIKRNSSLQQIVNELQKRNVLLVIDNLDTIRKREDIERMEQFVSFKIPKNNKVIFTSRVKIPELDQIGLVEIPLGRFNDTISYSFVKNIARKSNARIPLKQLNNILEMSGGNPLILRQFMAVLTQSDDGQVVAHMKGSKMEKILPYIFWSSVNRLSKKALIILLIIALATFPVDYQFIQTVTSFSQESITQALAELKSWSFVTEENGRFSIHELLEEFLMMGSQRLGKKLDLNYWYKVVRDAEIELS